MSRDDRISDVTGYTIAIATGVSTFLLLVGATSPGMFVLHVLAGFVVGFRYEDELRRARKNK